MIVVKRVTVEITPAWILTPDGGHIHRASFTVETDAGIQTLDRALYSDDITSRWDLLWQLAKDELARALREADKP